jgi:hypothetical protein
MTKKTILYHFICTVFCVVFLTAACTNNAETTNFVPTNTLQPTQESINEAEATPTWLVSTTNTPSANPSSLRRNPLDTEPCKAPCWEGITPGSTTIEEVTRILVEDKGLSECLPSDNWIVCENISIQFDAENFVQFIQMWPSDTVTLGEVIAVHGEPNVVYFCHDINELHEISHTHSLVYFVNSQLWLYFIEPGYPAEVIQPAMIVRDIAYGPTEYDWTLWGCESYKHTIWQGYGDYHSLEE